MPMSMLRSLNSDLHAPVSATLNTETGIILVHLDKVDYGYMDQAVRYLGQVFQPKSELHITIVSQDAEHILKYLNDHPQDSGNLQDLILSTDWSFRKQEQFYHVVESPEIATEAGIPVETIIQMVELPMLQAFLKDLSKLVGRGFELPPTHVTLYTRGTEKGISLPNQIVFKELVKASMRPRELWPIEETPPAGPGNDQGLMR